MSQEQLVRVEDLASGAVFRTALTGRRGAVVGLGGGRFRSSERGITVFLESPLERKELHRDIQVQRLEPQIRHAGFSLDTLSPSRFARRASHAAGYGPD